MAKEKTVTIEWRTTWNQKCSKQVPESQAEEEAERLRTLPDVKTETVEIKG
jgi:hypothetical protein